ncbi:alpha/beta hydrolase fold domain-containing protein [bacterium]|nr:alpha/beta hydrolase fold domain-containing protein [bacterium]
MNRFAFLTLTLALTGLSIMSTPIPAADVITLWPNGTPGAKGTEPVDIPTLTVYRPAEGKNAGAAVVVCPGGGYGGLAPHEGQPIAEWLASNGITAFVLKYRLGPRYQHPAMIDDANRAIRTVRTKASEFGIDPKRIGILGFSAGGHLASTAGTHYDAGKPDATDIVERASSRPDFMVLLYPVISLGTKYGHGGSKKNLLGENPPEDLVKNLTNELQVNKNTPPAFLVHTNEDTPVPAENSLFFVQAMRNAGVPCEFHMFEKGRHGLGLGMGDPAFSEWPKLCEIWFRQRGILPKAN